MTETEVVERYTPIARRWARRRGVMPWNLDDAVQDAMVRVITAHRSYASDLGGTYHQWVMSGLCNAIRDSERRRSRWSRHLQRSTQPETLSLEYTATFANGEELTIGDLLTGGCVDPEMAAVATDLEERVRLKTWSDADARVLDGMLAGRLKQDIAADLGVTPSRVSQRVTKIRERLANAM